MEIDWWLKTYVGVYDDKVSYFSFYIPVHVLTGLECNRFEDLRTYIDIISVFTGEFRYMKNDLKYLVIDNTLNDKDINIREIYCFY
jgi:hypothetical protein